MSFVRITHYKSLQSSWSKVRSWNIVVLQPGKSYELLFVGEGEPRPLVGDALDWFQVDFFSGSPAAAGTWLASVGGLDCYLQAREKRDDPHLLPWENEGVIDLSQPEAAVARMASQLNIWLRIPCALLDLHRRRERSVDDEKVGDGECGWLAFGLHAFGASAGLKWERGVPYVTRMGLALGGQTWGIPWTRQLQWFISDREEPILFGALPDHLSGGKRSLAYPGLTRDVGLGFPRRASTTIDSSCERILGLRSIHQHDGDLHASWTEDGVRTLRLRRRFTTTMGAPSAFFRGAQRQLCLEQSLIRITGLATEDALLTKGAPGGLPAVAVVCLAADAANSSAAELFNRGWQELLAPEQQNTKEGLNFLFNLHWPAMAGTEVEKLCAAFPPLDVLLSRKGPRTELALIARPPFSEWRGDQTVSLSFDKIGYVCQAYVRQRRIWQDSDGSWQLELPVEITLGAEHHPMATALGDLDVWLSPAGTNRPFTAKFKLSPTGVRGDSFHPLRVDSFALEGLAFGVKHVAVGGAAPAGNSASLTSEIAHAPLQVGEPNDLRFRPRLIAAENPAMIVPMRNDLGGYPPLGYTLNVEETVDRHRERRLAMRLTAEIFTPSNRKRLRLLYINRAPFFVSVVDLRDLLNFDRTEGNEIAYWTTEGLYRGWQLRAAADNFTLWLPPQGFGEEMEKGRLSEGYNDINTEEGEKAVTEFVALCFTPPSRLVLKSHDETRRYGTAPWNLQMMLDGSRAGGSAGLALKTADFEMLYGLRFRLQKMPWLRIAETSARLGLPAGVLRGEEASYADLKKIKGRLSQEDLAALRSAAKRWSDHLEVYARRLAVYELYDPRHIDFRPADQGAGAPTDPNADLRKDARVDLHLAGSGREGAVTAALRTKALRNLRTSFPWTPPIGGTLAAEGLAGSFAWAFESERLFEALYGDHLDNDGVLRRDVEAVEATVARLSFSAVGGWGQQQATFDKGNALIAATVEPGRVSELRVERVGRIGVFGNPAKLVTIFRRTVVPTEQFFLQQDDHLGRAIIRKVEEYVEFTPAYRAFPREGAQASACIVGCSCNEKIPVDSRWGENVDIDGKPAGWRVPLHRTGALESVYGKANISLHFRTDPRGSQQECAQRIENYERLWFYTDTSRKVDADTDKWRLVADVDYPLTRTSLPRELESRDGEIPSAIPAGYEAFTFRLGPAHTPTDLVGHRDSSKDAAAICSRLKYVTVCRPPGNLVFEETNKVELAENTVDACSGAFDNILGFVEEVMAGGAVPADKQTTFTELVGAVKNSRLAPRKEGFCSQLAKAQNELMEAAHKAVARNVDWVFRQAERELLGICDRVAVELIGHLKEKKEDVVKAQEKFDQFWTRYLSVVPGTLEHALARLEIAKKKTDIEAILEKWTEVEPLDEVKKDIEAALKEGSVAKAKEQITTAARKIAEVEARFNEATATLEAAWARLANLPWLRATQVKLDPQLVTRPANVLRQRLQVLREQVSRLAEIEYAKWVPEEVRKKWDALWKEAAEELRGAAGRLQAGWKTFSTDAANFQEAVDAALGKLRSIAAAEGRTLDDVRLALRAKVTGTIDQIEAGLRKAVEEETAKLPAKIKEFGEKTTGHIVTALASQSAGLWSKPEELCGKLDAFVNGFGSTLKTFVGAYKGNAAELEKWVRQQREAFHTLLNATPRSIMAELGAGLDGKFASTDPGHALRLPRAFGIVPEVPMMDFQGMAVIKDAEVLAHRIRSVGFRFPTDVLKGVDMTPVTSLLDRAKDEVGGHVESLKLKAAALQMKVNKLTDRLEADIESLKKTALSRLLPDFGGIKLEKLAVAAGIDAELARQIKERVKLKHGFDRQTMTGFVDARIEGLELGQPLTLFGIGPLAVRVMAPTLNSSIRIEKGADGRIQRNESAKFKGDWAFVVGGRDMVTFIDTTIACDNGDLKIDLDPRRMKLDGALQGLIDGAKTYSAVQGEDEPFSYGVKVEFPDITSFCRLDLVFPPVQAGTFAIAGLSLGALLSLTLRINPLKPAESEFKITAGFNLASEDLPFSIIVFILGGCGWFSFQVVYTVPFSGKPKLRINFSVAIGVAASLGLNLGFAQGFVLIAFAIRASCTETHSSFSAVLTFAGRLRIIGMFDVSLTIVLSISYETGGGLVGQGRICVKFKICWCVTIRVERSFTYRFGKAKQQGAKGAALPGPLPALAAGSGSAIPASVFWNRPAAEAIPARLPREFHVTKRNYFV